jgi:predicted ATPase
MLKKIRIKNFKAFRDTGDIEIRPITILTGVNSSGKSSIMQALLVLRQTIESRDTEVPLHVVGDYIDLGSYVDCVFQHRIAQKHATFLSFEYSIVPDSMGSAVRRYALLSRIAEDLSRKLDFREFHVSVAFGYNKKARTIYLRNFELKDANNRVVISATANAANQLIEGRSEALTADFDSKTTVKSFYKNLQRRKFFYEYKQRPPKLDIFRDESYAEERQLTTFTSACYDATEQEFSKVFYLGPLRRKTPRYNPVTGETPQDVGFEGEHALKVIYKDFKASKRQSKNLVEKLKYWLKKFNVGIDLKVVTMSGNQFRLNIVDSHNNAIVNLSDVGFGVSQILPVIVEGFYAPRGSMILVEQPEIHLHPALESELGDLLSEISKEGKTVIVETHSEHLLLRLQKRVAEGALDANDVAIYFVEPGKDGSTVERVGLNKYGQFINWPQGFFEEDIREGLEHLKIISEKMQLEQALNG